MSRTTTVQNARLCHQNGQGSRMVDKAQHSTSDALQDFQDPAWACRHGARKYSDPAIAEPVVPTSSPSECLQVLFLPSYHQSGTLCQPVSLTPTTSKYSRPRWMTPLQPSLSNHDSPDTIYSFKCKYPNFKLWEVMVVSYSLNPSKRSILQYATTLDLHRE